MSEPAWLEKATTNERSNFKQRGTVPLRIQIRKCEVCIAPFVPEKNMQKTCDSECRKALDRQMRSDWRKQNKEKYNSAVRIRYKKLNLYDRYKKDKKERLQRWKTENRDQLNKKEREKRKADPYYRLKENARNSVHKALKKQYTKKDTQSATLIGMTGEELMCYLLSHEKCKPEFTRENYGTVWHLDHIKPLAAFDLNDKEQQKLAFHYTNCQPLEAIENLSKGSLYDGERHLHAKQVQS